MCEAQDVEKHVDILGAIQAYTELRLFQPNYVAITAVILHVEI